MRPNLVRLNPQLFPYMVAGLALIGAVCVYEQTRKR